MAKRFIDTDLFRKPFMRSLEAPYKALWIYLLCECDHAGIWVVELDVAQIRMGLKLDHDKVIEKMQGAVVSIDGGSKWFLPDFVTFQYGTLNPQNRVHASVIERLERYGLDPNGSSQNKPLPSPLQGAKDKDKDKDTQKRKEPEREIEWPPWAGEKVKATWEEFKAYKRTEKGEGYKSKATEQKAVNLLAEYYTTGKECFDGLNLAMAKGWKFPVAPSELSQTFAAKGKGPMTKADAEAWIEKYKERLGLKPGDAIPTAEIPNDIYHAWRGYAKS